MSKTTAPPQTSAAPPEGAQPGPLFYRRPELLNPTAHGTWRLKPGGVGFTAEANWVPVMASEFVAAGQSYPLIFAGAEHVPVAVLSFTQRNRFVKGEDWQSDAYMPAYVRRYPFVFAQVEGGFALAIDADAPNVVKSGAEDGEPLFVDGKPSLFTQQAMQFCELYSRESATTQAFVKLLEEQKLLVERTVNITLPQETRPALTGFSVVDDAAFAQLPDALVADWHRKGWLALIYAHLGSLVRFRALLVP
jgi:hypothetical protein